MPGRRIVVEGLAAGVIGATLMAIWFLLIDTLQGRPFFTPAFLARILVHTEETNRSLLLIASYTLIHYAAFAVVGLLVAGVLGKLEVGPAVLMGIVLGFLLFDAVFYLGVILTGVDVVRELGWPHVLLGNLLAGVGVTVYLQRRLGLGGPGWLAALGRHRIVREGVACGVLGAGAVALWFLAFDLVRGRLLFTPGALGSAVLLGVSDLAGVQINLATVAGYTLVHLAAFILVGLVAAAIAVQAEKSPPLLLAGILIFATFEALFLGLLAIVAEWLLGALGWVSIGVGNLLATGVMAYYLLHAHPRLRAALAKEAWSAEDSSTV